MPTHTPHVIVLSHRIDGDSASKSYAVYRIRTVESDFACEVERRWSHVRTLYNELWSKWKAQLQRSDWSPPSFSHHTVGRRTDEVLLARREIRRGRSELSLEARRFQIQTGDLIRKAPRRQEGRGDEGRSALEL